MVAFAYATVISVFFGITFLLVKPVPVTFSKAYGWLRFHKNPAGIANLNYIVLISIHEKKCANVDKLKIPDDVLYYDDYVEKGGIQDGPFETFIRSIWVIFLYGIGVSQPDFVTSCIGTFAMITSTLLIPFVLVPGILPVMLTSAASIYTSFAVVLNINRYITDICRRKIYVLESSMSEVLKLPLEEVSGMTTETVMELDKVVKATVSTTFSTQTPSTVVEDLNRSKAGEAPTPKLSMIRKIFSVFVPPHFKSWDDEKGFFHWNHKTFIKLFRVNTTFNLILFLADPLLNNISYCGKSKIVKSPTLCLDTSIGWFLYTFRLAFYPVTCLLFLTISAMKSIPPIVHQSCSILMTLMHAFASIYLIARVSKVDPTANDGTTSLFISILYTRITSMGCGSKLSLRPLSIALLLIVFGGISTFKAVSPQSPISGYIFVEFNTISASIMVFLENKGLEEMDRRLYALLRIFDVCNQRETDLDDINVVKNGK
ncbi:hypothetical protein HDU97_005864 [Phlyctochytrium planicorne]|nr:hypothetical protein HDU97_005864 [Phlyctochytrium planicorne]